MPKIFPVVVKRTVIVQGGGGPPTPNPTDDFSLKIVIGDANAAPTDAVGVAFTFPDTLVTASDAVKLGFSLPDSVPLASDSLLRLSISTNDTNVAPSDAATFVLNLLLAESNAAATDALTRLSLTGYGETLATPADDRNTVIKVWLNASAGTGVTNPGNANGPNDGVNAVIQTAALGATTESMDSDCGNNVTVTGTYVILDGSGDHVSSPDNAAFDITGDIDIRWAGPLDDWTPGGEQSLLTKWNAGGNQKSYRLSVLSTGILRFITSATGSNEFQDDSTAAPSVANGSPILLRVTRDQDDGSGNRVTKYFTKPFVEDTVAADLASDTGWTQLGATVTTAGTTSIFNSTAQVSVGSENGTGQYVAGKIYGAVIKNGIDGTTVSNPSFRQAGGTTSFVDGSGRTWTLQGNAAIDRTFTNVKFRSWHFLQTSLATSTAKVVAHSDNGSFGDLTIETLSAINGSIDHLGTTPGLDPLVYDLVANGIDTLRELQSCHFVYSTTDAVAGVSAAQVQVDAGAIELTGVI